MPSTAQGFIGAGDVMLNPYTVGNAQSGYEAVTKAGKLEIKPNSEIKELPSKGRDDYGQVLATVSINKPADFSLTLTRVDATALKLMFMAESEAISQSSATVTDEAVVAKLEKWARLTKRNIQAGGFSITNTAEDVTYVKDVDYEINYRLGMVRPLDAGSITADQALKVNYTANAISGTRLLGAKKPSLRCSVLLDGKNLVDDSPVLAEVFEATLTPQAGFDFFADDWNECVLEGRMATPIGKTSPFIVEFPDFA